MLKYKNIPIALFATAVVIASCQKQDQTMATHSLLLTDVPKNFPAIPFPEDNQFSQKKWELGKRLFYDKMLSADNSLSCASCHKATLAFSDNVAFSNGVAFASGVRNASSLANVAYHPYYTREGGVPTLEMHILVPIQEHNEFNFNIVEVATRMKALPEYVTASKEIFGREPDAYVITRAIATFERTLISGNSAYDKYIRKEDENALSASARRGETIFFSERTQCATCHSGFNFTNYAFENNGLSEVYTDIGRERFTGKAEDNALFKVPSLRNVAITAPYMHDGSFKTLEEVIENYNSGGQNHPHKSKLIKPLSLSETEKQDLIAFLTALTDANFLHDQRFKNDTP